jgi:hypothetical protein
MNIARLIPALAAATVIAGLALPATAATTAITIPMKALNNSNENGSATLTQQSGGVKVVVTLKNAPAAAQPTHIHIGTCGKIKAAPEYALVSTVNGTSTTVVKGVSLDQLLAGTYAINVHKSASDLGTYVSCGNIKAGP